MVITNKYTRWDNKIYEIESCIERGVLDRKGAGNTKDTVWSPCLSEGPILAPSLSQYV